MLIKVFVTAFEFSYSLVKYYIFFPFVTFSRLKQIVWVI